MTEDPERELTPEEDARIRSLLASARASPSSQVKPRWTGVAGTTTWKAVSPSWAITSSMFL